MSQSFCNKLKLIHLFKELLPFEREARSFFFRPEALLIKKQAIYLKSERVGRRLYKVLIRERRLVRPARVISITSSNNTVVVIL